MKRRIQHIHFSSVNVEQEDHKNYRKIRGGHKSMDKQWKPVLFKRVVTSEGELNVPKYLPDNQREAEEFRSSQPAELDFKNNPLNNNHLYTGFYHLVL